MKSLKLPLLSVNIFLFISIGLLSCIHKKAEPAERMLTPAEVQQDKYIFTEILHEAHPDPYLYISSPEIGQMAATLLPDNGKQMSVRELYQKLSAITDRIGCAHTVLGLPELAYDSLRSNACLFPYPLTWIDGKLMLNMNTDEPDKGTEITSVNGHPVKELMKKLAIYETNEGRSKGPEYESIAANFTLDYYYEYGPEKFYQIAGADSAGKPVSRTSDAINLTESDKRYNNERYYYDHTDVPYDFYIDEARGYATLH